MPPGIKRDISFIPALKLSDVFICTGIIRTPLPRLASAIAPDGTEDSRKHPMAVFKLHDASE